MTTLRGRSAQRRLRSARTPGWRRMTATGRTPWPLAPPARDGGGRRREVTVTGTAALTTAAGLAAERHGTLTGDTNLNGTLTFQLYTGEHCGLTRYTPSQASHERHGHRCGVREPTFSTENTPRRVLDGPTGTYSWLVTYDDDNLGRPGPSSARRPPSRSPTERVHRQKAELVTPRPRRKPGPLLFAQDSSVTRRRGSSWKRARWCGRSSSTSPSSRGTPCSRRRRPARQGSGRA